jgi:hypothetical protein
MREQTAAATQSNSVQGRFPASSGARNRLSTRATRDDSSGPILVSHLRSTLVYVAFQSDIVSSAINNFFRRGQVAQPDNHALPNTPSDEFEGTQATTRACFDCRMKSPDPNSTQATQQICAHDKFVLRKYRQIINRQSDLEATPQLEPVSRIYPMVGTLCAAIQLMVSERRFAQQRKAHASVCVLCSARQYCAVLCGTQWRHMHDGHHHITQPAHSRLHAASRSLAGSCCSTMLPCDMLPPGRSRNAPSLEPNAGTTPQQWQTCQAAAMPGCIVAIPSGATIAAPGWTTTQPCPHSGGPHPHHNGTQPIAQKSPKK